MFFSVPTVSIVMQSEPNTNCFTGKNNQLASALVFLCKTFQKTFSPYGNATVKLRYEMYAGKLTLFSRFHSIYGDKKCNTFFTILQSNQPTVRLPPFLGVKEVLFW